MILQKSLIKRRTKSGRPAEDLWIPPDLNTRKLPKINAPDIACDRIYWIQRVCCIVDGPLQDQPFRMLAWQWLVMWQLFGTLRDDGFRQYQHVYIQIPKKNIKSQWMACLALLCLAGDGEKGAHVICGAKDKEQGKYIFEPAMYMAEKWNERSKKRHFRVYKSPLKITYPNTNGKIILATGEVHGKQGAGPSAFFGDELSEWIGEKGQLLWRTHTRYASRGRKQPLIFSATTANIKEEGSIYQIEKKKAIDAALHPEKYPEKLSVLYLPTDKDIEYLKKKHPTRSMLKRLNPAIPTVFNLENEYQNAKKAYYSKDPTERQDLFRFILNIDISALHKWMMPEVWAACNFGEIDEASLDGRPCYVGMDLSTGGQDGGDLSAVVWIFPPDDPEKEKVQIICRFYLPLNRILKHSGQMTGKNIRKDAADYARWHDEGWIKATPGDFVAHGEILKDVAEMSDRFDVQHIGFDPTQANKIVEGLVTDHGFSPHSMTGIANTPVNFNESCGNFMTTVLKKGINHGGNPVLAFCFDNLQMRKTTDGLMRPEKQLLSRSSRIDGAIGTLYGWNRYYSKRTKNRDVPNEALVIR